MMELANKAKVIVKQILPPIITTAIQRARGVPQSTKARLVEEKQYPLSRGASIVGQAKQHLEQVTRALDMDGMPPSKRWTAYLERMRGDISRLATTRDVIFYAQSRIGFNHRGQAAGQLPYFQLYEDTLKSEFPHFYNMINEMGDSPYSRPETLLEISGRLVSNVFFYHLRYLLQCLTHVKEPEIVCEIGGGYGGLARLWLQNPVHLPSVYVMVDFPECLFFAEVFLRVNFDELKLLYVTPPPLIIVWCRNTR